VAVVDALNNVFAVAAVAELGVVFESVEADAAGPFAATMPREGAAPAGSEEIMHAEIGELDAMPGLTPAGASIIPPAVPSAHDVPRNFSKSNG
jgi:hypothetical protein